MPTRGERKMNSKTNKETGISSENQAVLNDRAFFGHSKGVGNSLFVVIGSWFADRVFGAKEK